MTTLKNFTPLIDSLTQDHGVMVSAVYGTIWRFCQMRKHHCEASHNTIADILSCSTKTIQRHIKTLILSGYIIDLTPDIKNVSHIYKTTDKLTIKSTVEFVKSGVDNLSSQNNGVDNLSNGVDNLSNGVDNLSNGVDTLSSEETKNKQINKQDKTMFNEFVKMLKSEIYPASASFDICQSIEFVEYSNERLIISMLANKKEVLVNRQSKTIVRIKDYLGIGSIMIQERF